MAASALLSSLCLAASFAVPEMPDAEWDDTEVVTNAALSATANGRTAFAALAAHPPRFLYSREWDTVRVVCRGMDSPNPAISGSIDNIPLAIRIR